MCKRYIKCESCLFCLLADDDVHLTDNYMLIKCKDRGGLIIPCMDLVKICNAAESVVYKLDVRDEKKYDKLVVYTMRILDLSKIFNNLTCQRDDEDDDHKYSLIKIIILCYGKIKFHFIVKQINLEQDQVRNHINRIIINAHHQ